MDSQKDSGGSRERRYTIKKSVVGEAERRVFKINYEQDLNPGQLEVVRTIDVPVLVIAGAGTGKTKTLIYRVAYLVELGCNPQSILLLTFTRKAANEMLKRAGALLKSTSAEDVAGGTFHSFANMTLRHYAKVLGYGEQFTILDDSDAADVVNLLRTRLSPEKKSQRFPKKETLVDIYSKSENTLTKIDEIVFKEYPRFIEQIDDILKLKKQFDDYKRKYNLMDYDDLLKNLRELLAQNESVRKAITSKYAYVMVDEFQDTNKVQGEIVRYLGMDKDNVMVVGDDAQSIYSFRGANFKNIFDFPSYFPNCKIIKLTENYRSSQGILNFTNKVIDAAKEKYEKELYSRKKAGGRPAIVGTENENVQSKFVVQRILELREAGITLNDIAVLFRSSYLSFDLEIELTRANIPYVKFGGMKLVEAAHIKDVVAFLRVIENSQDAVGWHRILLLHPGVGPRVAEKVLDRLAHAGTGEKDAGQGAETKIPSSAEELIGFITGEGKKFTKPIEKVESVLRYYEPLMRDKYDDYAKREKDLVMFASIAERYKSLQTFLADLALEPPTESVVDLGEKDMKEEQITISTIHSAKGLEWNSVFLIWALDGKFPSMYATDDDEAIEEERRLMYVACTRAKENLYVTYPMNVYDRESGKIFTKPSRFIEVVPSEFYERWNLDFE
ncbi:MAG: ATP-dependent helicase [Bacteroidetes bacterium]|nr:ATP-dependent helicase [Bacteroidota bacterium]